MTRSRRARKAGSSDAGQSTRDAILDSAERLFARYGVQGVSVRRILADADVNVALAHYHFGDREGVIREVLRRRVEPLNKKRMKRLDAVEAAAGPEGPRLEDVLRAFLSPVVELLDDHPDFARVAGQFHVGLDDKMREYFTELFAGVLRRFSDVLSPALPPDLTGPQRVSRAHFVFGAMAHLLTNRDDLEVMTRGRFDAPRGEALLRELVAFCAAGLSAPVTDAGEAHERKP
jgi:AcrR family transcriptional regulator